MPLIGLELTLRKLEKYEERVKEEIKTAVELTTREIELQAINNAPRAGEELQLSSSNIKQKGQNTQKNNTNIAGYIKSRIFNKDYTGEIYIEGQASLLAVYLEFGTGASAAGYVPTLPTEFQQIARKYYINGKGTLIKKPYFLPAYFENAPKLTERIRAILKKK